MSFSVSSILCFKLIYLFYHTIFRFSWTPHVLSPSFAFPYNKYSPSPSPIFSSSSLPFLLPLVLYIVAPYSLHPSYLLSISPFAPLFLLPSPGHPSA
jgi:hypothetical protein